MSIKLGDIKELQEKYGIFWSIHSSYGEYDFHKNKKLKPDTPYTPRRGSSVGKLKTRQIGARRVERDFRKMMEAIFSITDGLRQYTKKRAKMPKISVDRYIS